MPSQVAVYANECGEKVTFVFSTSYIVLHDHKGCAAMVRL